MNIVGNVKYTNITSEVTSVFGGVSLDIKDWGILKRINSAQQDLPYEEGIITVNQSNAASQKTRCWLFPFLTEKYCQVCSEKLSNKEMYLSPGQPFCKYHNPNLCHICLKEFKTEYLIIKEIKIHPECFECDECYMNIIGQYTVINEEYMHPECAMKCRQMESREEYQFNKNHRLLVKRIHDVFEGYFLQDECYEALKKNSWDENLAVELLVKLKEIYDETGDNQEEEEILTNKNLEIVNADVILGKSQMREERDLSYLIKLNLGFDKSIILEVYETCNKDKTRTEQALFRMLD